MGYWKLIGPLGLSFPVLFKLNRIRETIVKALK